MGRKRREDEEWEWQASEKSRLFLSAERLREARRGGTLLEVEGDDAHHVARVLRLRAGDPVTVADGAGTEWTARLEGTDDDPTPVRAGSDVRIRLRILEGRPTQSEPPFELVLVQGLPKGEKMDHIVRKGVEVGVTRILPVMTRRSVPRYEGKKAADRAARWQRVAREAARQSRRGRIPTVEPIRTWEAGIGEAEAALRDGTAVGYVAWEMERRVGLRNLLSGLEARPRRAYFCIGPEGGLHAEEVAAATRLGFQTAALGPRILRTETAGSVALCMLLYAWGDLGNANNSRVPAGFQPGAGE